MRKLFTLTLAAAAVMSVSAQQKAPSLANLQKVAGPSIEAKAAQATPVHNLGHGNHKFHTIEKANVVTGHASRGNDAIYEAPGTSQDYSTASLGWYNYWGSLYFWDFTGFTSISTDGNDVYIKNPIYTLPLDSYIKGTVDGNKITVQLPQTLVTERMEYPEYEIDCAYDYYITKLERYYYTYVDEETGEEAESFWYQEVTEDNFVTFTINEDGTIVLDPLCEELYGEDGYPNAILGATEVYTDYITGEVEDHGWAGYGDCEQTYTEDYTLDNVITLPEGIEMDPNWAFTSGDFIEAAASMVSVGFDGDYVYVQGLSLMFPDAVLRGEFNAETSQYTFPASQVLGFDSYYGLMFYWLTTTIPTVDEEGYFGDYEFIDGVFNFDSRTKRIVSAQDQMWWENAAEDYLYYLTGYNNPMLKYQDPDEQNGNPVNPVFNYYYDKYNAFNFTMPVTNVYGAILDANKMYYNIYVNDMLYTYYGEDGNFYNKNTGEYYDEDAVYTDIPYTLAEDDWLYWYSSDNVDIAVPSEGVTSIGVQVFFEGTDGVLYHSELVTGNVDGETTGLNSINAQDVKSVEYYNLAGVRVANPTTGIYVKRNIMNDGNVKVQKVAIR